MFSVNNKDPQRKYRSVSRRVAWLLALVLAGGVVSGCQPPEEEQLPVANQNEQDGQNRDAVDNDSSSLDNDDEVPADAQDDTSGDTSGDDTSSDTSGDDTSSDTSGDDTSSDTSGDDTSSDTSGDDTSGDTSGGDTSDDDGGQTQVELPDLVVTASLDEFEGDSGTNAITVEVGLSRPSTETVSINYSTTDGTASGADSADDLSNADFIHDSGVLTFSPGQLLKSIELQLVGDGDVETNENFTLNLVNSEDELTEVVIAIINDDELVYPSIDVQASAEVSEGDLGTTFIMVDVEISEAYDEAVTVAYETENLTATQGSDFVYQSGSLTFNPSETRKSVQLSVLTDDVAEIDETFRLSLSYVDAPVETDDAAVVISILNDDVDGSVLLANPGPQVIDEEDLLEVSVIARPSARVLARGLAPGMHWDEEERKLRFQPDFIQGGQAWEVTLEAFDGSEGTSETFTVTVNDSITPPAPVIIDSVPSGPNLLITVEQTTDSFLDSPGQAGRTFEARLLVPTGQPADAKLPVRMNLHGYGGAPMLASSGGIPTIQVAPHDPENSWWTGYNENLPGPRPTSGVIHNYTQRRMLNLLKWVLDTYEQADASKVTLSGQSMGGTGTIFMAARHARHFAHFIGLLAGTAPGPIGQSPSWNIVTTLEHLWGDHELNLLSDTGINAWQLYDITSAIESDLDTRNSFFTTVSGKNDNIILFSSMVGVSDFSGKSFSQSLQENKIGHFTLWDQRSHSSKEADLDAEWWTIWDNDVTYLNRDLAFPAFSNSTADDDIGVEDGEGGYTGDLRGAVNRYLIWDSAAIVDDRNQFSMPIRVRVNTDGTPSSDPDMPAMGDDYFGSLPIRSNVTIRRVQHFQTLAGEAVSWEYGDQFGTAYAGSDGSITITGLEIDREFVPLVLTRQQTLVFP